MIKSSLDIPTKNSIFLIGDPVKWEGRKGPYVVKTVFFDNGLRYSLSNQYGVECGCRIPQNELFFNDLCTSFQMRGIAIEHDENVLYVKKTPITDTMIQHYEFFHDVNVFPDENNEVWYEIPSAYNDFWEKKIQ